MLLNLVDLVVDVVVKLFVELVLNILRQVVIEVLVRVLGDIHGSWHLLLGHHWATDRELSVLPLSCAHALHAWAGEWKHVLVETLHIYYVREALRHRLEVALHARHVGHLDSVAEVVVRDLSDVHVTELIDVVLSGLVDLPYLALHLAEHVRVDHEILSLIWLTLTENVIDVKFMSI